MPKQKPSFVTCIALLSPALLFVVTHLTPQLLLTWAVLTESESSFTIKNESQEIQYEGPNSEAP